MKKPLQFNWRRNWKKKVEPHLQKDIVQECLDIGMTLMNRNWKRGDPPYLEGRDHFGRVVRGKLSWYQPWGACHYIAFFSIAIGVLNYPHLDWRFVCGPLHTVPVGYDGQGEPAVVMDILLFDLRSGAGSIELAKQQPLGLVKNNPGALRACRRAVKVHRACCRLFCEKVLPLIQAVARNQKSAKPELPQSSTYALRARLCGWGECI
jgi:hypothetical protein